VSPTKQDDETAKESTTPDFLKGIDISPEEEQQMEDAAYSGAAEDIAEREGLSKSDLKDAEENPTTPEAPGADPKEGYKAGFGYRDEDKHKDKSKKKGSFLNRNKKWFIGGGVGSGIAGLLLSILLLLPLKVQHIANNLQSHYFSSSEQATDKVTEALFRQYIVKKVVPGMYKSDACTTTRANRSCVAVTPGDGPVARLFSAWRDKNFEGKLADNQGIEIRREGNKFFMRKGNMELFSGIYDEKNPKIFEDRVYSQMNRTDARREMRKAFENETFAKRMMYRYKVGRFLERKYAIKRCLVACETRDKRADRTEARKLKWKFYFIDRIETPRTAMLNLAIKCAVGGFDCANPDKAETESDGSRVTQMENDLLRDIRASGVDAPEVQRRADSIAKKGVTGHLVEEITKGAIKGVAVKAGIPVIGWIDLFARIRDGLETAGPAIKRLNYAINSQTMVTMYMMYRTNADEIKTGEADGADIGIVANSLGSDAGTDQGGASAEEAPIYQEIMGNGSLKTASIFSAITPRADAFNGYKCNDDSTITSGVCPEVTLGALSMGAKGAAFISDVFNSKAMAAGGVASDVWLASVGKLFDLGAAGIGKLMEGGIFVIRHTPIIGDGFDYLVANGEKLIQIMGKWVVVKLVNDPIGNSPSGGRNYEIAAGGADVAGNTYAHYGLGGQRISDTAAAEIRIARQQQEKEDFLHESTFARVFDTSSQHSLVSRVALAMPSTTSSGLSRSMASSLLNPLAAVSNQFGSSKKTSAASTNDAYGVSQYGYSPGDPVFAQEDLQAYWDKNDCSNPDKAKQWGDAEKGNINPDTGMSENDRTNGCKLIETSVGMAGGYLDSSLLGEDEPTANVESSNDTTSPLGACYSVTKLSGQKIQGKQFHMSGSQTYAFENSPEGIRFAAKQGYDSIDLDIQITKDKIPVATHWGQPMIKEDFYDPTNQIPRDTRVEEMTLEQISRLRHRDGQSQIYSLEHMIKIAAENNINLAIEFKVAVLAKKLPEITALLNQYNVKAFIKADARRDALNKALGTARNFGFWTRGTLGTQDWKAPTPTCQSSEPNSQGWVWPVPDVESLGTLDYGESGSKGVHKGIDIGESGGKSLGKTVVAAHAGTVERVWGQSDDCGAYVSIKASGTNYYAAYQHLAGNSITVKAGDQVTAGTPVGKIGKQGGSTCGSSGFYHLHFSVESSPGVVSAYADPFPNGTINPLTVLRK
jgi:murein DD-endopeptidase MepM/ murein hydrolase activator NlpD